MRIMSLTSEETKYADSVIDVGGDSMRIVSLTSEGTKYADSVIDD